MPRGIQLNIAGVQFTVAVNAIAGQRQLSADGDIGLIFSLQAQLQLVCVEAGGSPVLLFFTTELQFREAYCAANFKIIAFERGDTRVQ